MFENPSPDAIRGLLRETRTVAVVGLSPKPARPSYRVAKAMQGFGYRIVPVRPAVAEVLGERAYPDLDALPGDLLGTVDLVDVFRAPEEVDALVDQCLRLGIKNIWLQDGVVNAPAAERARAGGMTVVMDRCLWRDYVNLCQDK